MYIWCCFYVQVSRHLHTHYVFICHMHTRIQTCQCSEVWWKANLLIFVWLLVVNQLPPTWSARDNVSQAEGTLILLTLTLRRPCCDILGGLSLTNLLSISRNDHYIPFIRVDSSALEKLKQLVVTSNLQQVLSSVDHFQASFSMTSNTVNLKPFMTFQHCPLLGDLTIPPFWSVYQRWLKQKRQVWLKP